MARKLSGASLLIGLALGLYLLFGCAANAPFATQVAQDPTRTLWLVTPGWHSGVVLRRDDIPAARIPESSDFVGARYLEFGWGDREYYRNPEPGPWSALKAALVPGPSVLFLRGFSESPEAYFVAEEILPIRLPDPAFRQVIEYLHDSFDRRGSARATPLEPRLHRSSGFYEARGKFHLFHNCNAWTAGALHAAGLPLVPGGALTAGSLRCQAERWAETQPGNTEKYHSTR